MAAAHDVQALLMQLGSSAGKLRIARADEGGQPPRPLTLAWPELGALLPDGGLPRGVVELASPRALGGATSVALAAVCAGQARSGDAWCAWLDPEATLHAPGAIAAGVDLERMLVVRAPRTNLPRVAVKMVASGAFEVVVIDFDAVPGAIVQDGTSAARGERQRSQAHKHVRKLALAAEPSGTTVLLLTDGSKPRAVPWPVALRIELSRPRPLDLVVRIAKDRRGRVGLAKTIPFRPLRGGSPSKATARSV
jgi:RecA/RadA recombinase